LLTFITLVTTLGFSQDPNAVGHLVGHLDP